MGTEDGIVWFLRATENTVGRVRVIVLQGRVSHATLPQLGAVLAADNGRAPVIVDLAGVDYMNGAGVEAFQSAAARLSDSGGELLLCALPSAVRTAFDLAGALPQLRIEPTREAALRSVESSVGST